MEITSLHTSLKKHRLGSQDTEVVYIYHGHTNLYLKHCLLAASPVNDSPDSRLHHIVIQPSLVRFSILMIAHCSEGCLSMSGILHL